MSLPVNNMNYFGQWTSFQPDRHGVVSVSAKGRSVHLKSMQEEDIFALATSLAPEAVAEVREVFSRQLAYGDLKTPLSVFATDTGKVQGCVVMKEGALPGDVSPFHIFKEKLSPGIREDTLRTVVDVLPLALERGYRIEGSPRNRIVFTPAADDEGNEQQLLEAMRFERKPGRGPACFFVPIPPAE